MGDIPTGVQADAPEPFSEENEPERRPRRRYLNEPVSQVAVAELLGQRVYERVPKVARTIHATLLRRASPLGRIPLMTSFPLGSGLNTQLLLESPVRESGKRSARGTLSLSAILYSV